MSKLTSLNLIAPINTVSYGIVSLNILKNLTEFLDVCLWPIGEPQVTNKEDFDYVQRACENARSFDAKAPCIRIWHQFDMAQFVGKGPHIGFPIFELDKFNKIEKHNLKSVDHLFVCSEWAKEVILNEISEPCQSNIHVVPLGVNSDVFKPTPQIENKRFVFFNCGKWEVRKGHDILARAFNEAFSPDDNVELWLMTENPFCSKEEDLQWKKQYMDTPMFRSGKIKFIPRVASHEEVYKIMASTNCGIFPSRAEGWNLEALEMMSIGRPLVITDYSAHTQYCNENNSYLIPVKKTELAYDDKWFFGQGSWGCVEIEDIVTQMKRAYDQGFIFNTNGVETAQSFSWKNTAKEIVNVLESI